MFEFTAFLLPTTIEQPMHSPPALTEHVSLNLAGTFLLDPIYATVTDKAPLPLRCCFAYSFVPIRHRLPSVSRNQQVVGCPSNLLRQIGWTTNDLLVAWDGWQMVTNQKVKQHLNLNVTNMTGVRLLLASCVSSRRAAWRSAVRSSSYRLHVTGCHENLNHIDYYFCWITLIDSFIISF